MAEKKGKSEKAAWVNVAEQDLKSGEYKNVYLLYGSENVMVSRFGKRLVKALAGDDDGMNLSYFDDRTADPAQIITLADTLPFFADRRVIVVKDSGYFKKGCPELEEYLPKLPESTYIIFQEKEADKRLKLYKAAAAYGGVVEYGALDAEQLRIEVVRILRSENKTISRNAFELLTERCGSSLSDLHNELEKLICYTRGREAITEADIEALVRPRLEDKVFEMMNAMAERNYRKTLKCYYDILAAKTAPVMLLVLLSRQFERLLAVKNLRAKGTEQGKIASVLGVNPKAIYIYEKQAAHFSSAQLKAAMEDCIRAEEAFKSGRMSDRLSVETLIIKYASK
ncbi:MAG: DNA polymerase III subunit delta [Lachnospiraceae bacterium]|nr:DNA polymerase III subunit delta [Lachnospiraceae bacterium]